MLTKYLPLHRIHRQELCHHQWLPHRFVLLLLAALIAMTVMSLGRDSVANALSGRTRLNMVGVWHAQMIATSAPSLKNVVMLAIVQLDMA